MKYFFTLSSNHFVNFFFFWYLKIKTVFLFLDKFLTTRATFSYMLILPQKVRSTFSLIIKRGVVALLLQPCEMSLNFDEWDKVERQKLMVLTAPRADMTRFTSDMNDCLARSVLPRFSDATWDVPLLGKKCTWHTNLGKATPQWDLLKLLSIIIFLTLFSQ